MGSFGPKTRYSCRILSFLRRDSHYSLLSQCVHTGKGKAGQDLDVGHFVLPDLSSKVDTPQVKSIESCLLSGVTHVLLLYSSGLTTQIL